MKKNIFTIALLSLTALLIFTNCKKDEETTAPAAMTTAIIKGKVEANLNLTNDTTSNGFPQTQLELAVSGTKVIAVVNSADLVANPDPNVTYQDLTFEATIDANGEYSLTVDATTKAANYVLKFDDFSYDQRIMPDTLVVTERKVYTTADKNITVVKNAIKIQDVIYN